MFAGQSAGTITQFVDPDALTVYNVTDPNHIFNPGYVSRSVTTDMGYIMITTTGSGVGNYPLFNREIAGPAFTIQDLMIKSYVLNHGGAGF
jgi:hypothetical protein